MRHAALLDLDGTLVDANYQHALAWSRAFRRFDIVLPMWRLHRHIGMGGDQASSASQDDLDFFLDRLDARELVDGWTSQDDVERSKPHPDIVHAALERAGTDEAAFVGDSRWDVEAAAVAGLETICVITGGWSRQELGDAGAVAVYDSLVELRERLDETPLAHAADTMRRARWQ